MTRADIVMYWYGKLIGTVSYSNFLTNRISINGMRIKEKVQQIDVSGSRQQIGNTVEYDR